MSTAQRTIARMEQVCEAAAARQADCETWAAHQEVDELICRAGQIERRGTTHGSVLALSIWRDGLEGAAVADLDDEPSALVDEAISIAQLLPARPAPPRPVDVPRRFWRAALPQLDDATVQALVVASDDDHDLELRLRVERRTVALLRHGEAPRFYEAGTVHLRAQLGFSDDGGTSFIVEEGHGQHPTEVVDDYTRRQLPKVHAMARTLSGPARTRLDYDMVLVDGKVMTELMHALTPAFESARVRRGLSPLVYGERSFAPGLTIVDDMSDAHSPIHPPWDDEGTPVRRTELVHDGVVSGFLADRRTGLEAGSGSSGAGWRGQAGEAPTVRPGCLILQPAPELTMAPDSGRILRVVQSNGAHTADDLTGDFSIGAEAMVRDDEGRWHNTGQITVAGNLFAMLRDIQGHDGEMYVRRGLASGYYGSPGLWATGLAIGN